MTKPAPILEARITAALSATDIKAAELATLFQQTETAIAAAAHTAELDRTRALDPALSPDPKAARQAMEDAQFTVARLKTLLPKLELRWGKVLIAENEKAWTEGYREAEAMRDELADELRKTYLDAVERLVAVLSKIPMVDALVDHININAPSGAKERLEKVEQKARGIARFDGACRATRSSARWILSLLRPPRPWGLSSTRLAEPFLWPGLRRPSAVSDRSRRLEASLPVRSFRSPHSLPSSGKALARSIQGQSE
jgi:hypothetical protein